MNHPFASSMFSILGKFSALVVSASFTAFGLLASQQPAEAATPLNLVRLLPDPGRPRIYAINANGQEQGSLLVIDTLTRNTLSTIPLGKKPTDCDIGDGGKTLFAINSVDQTITVINLDTLAVTKTLTLPAYTNWGVVETHAHVRAGKGDILYYVDGQWGPRLRVYNRATGQVLQTFGASTTGTSNDDGIGGIALTPDGSSLFTWCQYGWSAGSMGTYLSKFKVNADGTLVYETKTTGASTTNFTRDPLDTPVSITADGSRAIIKDRAFLTSNPSEVPVIYPDEIYSITRGGEIASGASAIYAGKGGEILHTLPVSAPVQTITPDYASLVYFHPTTKALVWLDLVATLGTKALGLTIEPGDGSTVTQPSRLQWIPVTGIPRYQVYLGTSRAAVEIATPASASYLGETMDTWINLTTAPASGQTLFWRVVPIGADGLAAGTGVIRSFVVSNLTLSRSSIEAATVEGVPRHVETIDLTATLPQAWTATTDVSWITLESSSGSTPGKLVALCNATSLVVGTHQGKITLTSGGASFVIPVSLRVYAANYMIAETDLELPWVYAVSQENNNSTQPSFLLRINTATDKIESAVPCGRSVTDLTIHYQENRIYLTNWQTGILRAFDRTTFQQVRTWQFSPAGAVGYSDGDIWEVSAGKNGRLIVEEYDQWINMSLVNSADGKTISTGFAREGGGLFDPTGRYYYHGENNSSGAALRKYDTGAETFVELKSARVESFSYYGSRKVVMSGDGERIFWNGGVFDRDLEVKLRFAEQVIGSTFHSDLLFTSNKAYNGTNGLVLATLPVTANVMSVTGDQKKLYQFPANTKTFRVVDLSTIAALPPRQITPVIADGSTVIGTGQSLAWSVEPFASSYRVYFGTNRDAVANATETSTEYLGSTLTNAWNGTLPALALDGNYFWRVDTIGFSGSNKGTAWSFNVAPLAVSPAKLDLVLPVGAPSETRTLAISGPAGTAWTASTSTPWLSVVTAAGSTPGAVELRINATGLAAGTRQGSVTLQSGTDTWNLPVSLELLALNYTLAEADLEAPYIYAISQASTGTDDRAFMVVIDTRTQVVSRVVPVGRSATDLSIHYQENRIYVGNWMTGKLLAFDRGTFAELRSYSYSANSGVGTSSGDTYKVAAGRSGRVVIEQEDQWVNFFLIDTASGTKLATGYAREGGGVFEPTGRFYYHGENDSSGAELQKYDTQADTFVEVASKRVSSFNYYGSRRVLTSGDGSRVFWNGGVFDKDLGVLLQLNNEVVSSTYRGEVLFTDKAAINGVNGENLATLPVTTSIQGISADQKKLFLFNAGAFSVVDISTIAKVSPRGLIPRIADGSTVIGTAQELSWSLESAALSYDVYFGNSAAAVSAATTNSPEYLGNVSGTRWTGVPPAFALGGTYYWRVDIVGFNSTVTGSPWSFKIAPIDITPRSLDLAFPAGSPIPRQSLDMASNPSVSWTAATSTAWITLRSPSGATPGKLEFDLSSSGLTTGLKEGAITIQSGGDTFTVPIKLRVIALNVTKLIPHPLRPVVYGINTAAAGEGFSHLLEIDAATANILRSMPIGFSPTDADMDPATDRLYISNWGYSQTRVIDLAAWSELAPLALGEDVYRLEIAPGGKILTEGEDQWISLSMWNAATGAVTAAATSVREGDGETDPTGKFYYHCDNNISDAHITKYNISGNDFVQIKEGPEFGGYGSRNLILSGDGSRLFWVTRVLDADLNVLGQVPAEVYATNRTGDLAIGSGKIWWGDSATLIATLPFESMVAAVSAADSHLLRFNPTTKTLHSTLLSSYTDLPGPLPRPGQVVSESPGRISWSPVKGATAYRVYIAPDATALAAMTGPVAIVATPYYDLPSPLAFGRFYLWRVDVETATGVTTGAVRSFGIRFPNGPPLPMFGTGSAGISASLSAEHLLLGINGSAQLYQFNPATGANTPLQSFTLPGYYSDHQFGSAVAMDAGKAAVGAYAYDTPTDSGAAFVYRSGKSGYWEGSGPLVPPTPLAYEAFGRGLAASGNQMLVGTSSTSTAKGRVAAYITEPSTVRVQTFSASDGVAYDNFGQVMAMEGNQAIISSPGRGTSYNRLPVLYSFVRSTTTGLWTQKQKIAIPRATTYDNAGWALAVSGDYLAANNRATPASVEIFAKNTSGSWISSASVKQSAVPGSSTGSFGTSLALSGDLLFIGDTGATVSGTSGGAVFSFRRSGGSWIPGPTITPGSGTYNSFGSALAIRDGWLVVTGGSSQPAWLFRVDNTSNRTPRFAGNIPSQVVSGRAFSTEIRAVDADGDAGLAFDMLQGPSWLSVTSGSNGKASLDGIPAGNSGDVHTVQLRVRDSAGAEALHTYQLSLLAPTDMPVLTQEPVGGDFGEGQEVTLRAAVSGIGPFKWQWYRNGEAVSGANSPKLTFAEIGLNEAGVYRVRVSNVVGEVESAMASIAVHPANRFAGDWPTFGGSPRHTGYHPGRLGRHTFVPAWNRKLHATNPLNRVAIADGRVFASATSRFETAPTLSALNLTSGTNIWTETIASSNSINPPSWHAGTVYFQRGKGVSDTVGPQLIALDAATGTRKWASVFGAQWESYEAPAVTDEGIWINGGTYGGMYGFTLAGSQRFFQSMEQYDDWTPTVSNGRLFSWVAGVFREHNPADGTPLWSLNTDWDWNGWSMNNISAISGNSAVVISTTEIVCIDLPSRSIRWRSPGTFNGSPAIAGGRAYAIHDKSVLNFDLTNGSPGAVAAMPESIVSQQPLLLMDKLAVASSAKTYIIDPSTSSIVRTLAGGGLLSYSNGYLLAAGTEGTLRAWYANGAPEFAANLPASINAGDKGSDFKMNLASYASDIDPGDFMTWSVVTESLPSIVRSFELDPSSGQMSVVYNPYAQGSAAMTLAATDSAGNQTLTTLDFTLPNHPLPKVTFDPAIRFNRSNGLYEQKITVKNVSARAIWGFDLAVTGLRSGVSFHNATTKKNGGGWISYRKPLAAGQSVTLILKYYASRRGAIPQPVIMASVAIPSIASKKTNATASFAAASNTKPSGSVAVKGATLPATTPVAPFAINRFLREADGSVLIEFPTESGKTYRMQYSADAIRWNSCPEIIPGDGATMQWIDRGPPSTESTPASAPRRFYRVERLNP